MDKYESKSSRNRWKDEHRNPKLYDERTDTPGQHLNQTSNSSNTGSKSKALKNEIANQINQNLPEDMRISKLLRRLEIEDLTVSGTIEICEKLKSVVMDSANYRFQIRSFDMITNSIVTIMKRSSEEALPHVCEIFGMMGYVIAINANGMLL
jgi:hypothetical protein